MIESDGFSNALLGEVDFYLHHCCSSHFGRCSALPWYEPHSIQCLASAQRQLGQPWVQQKIFQEQIRHLLQLCIGQYSPEIARKKSELLRLPLKCKGLNQCLILHCREPACSVMNWRMTALQKKSFLSLKTCHLGNWNVKYLRVKCNSFPRANPFSF